MNMQRLSVAQVAVLKLLKESQELVSTDTSTNKENVTYLIVNSSLNIEEVEEIVEELQYWGYVDNDWNVKVLGRQYLKTGPDCDTNINIMNDFSKNYDVTLFEKLAELKGIEINFSAKGTMIEGLTNIFSWTKK